LSNKDFIRCYRQNDTDFTRDSKLTFPTLVLFLLNQVKGSLQQELDTFFQQINDTLVPLRVVGKSAFSEARKKLKSSVFIAVGRHIVEQVEQSDDLKTWKGFRLYAIDGSRVRLPNEQAVKEKYGCLGNGNHKHDCPMGLASACYDVLNDLMIDVHLGPSNGSERVNALEHLCWMSPQALAIYDRGYPAFWFMQAHLERSIDFCMRSPWNLFNETRDFYMSGKDEALVAFHSGRDAKLKCEQHAVSDVPMMLRLIRIDLPSGEVEILITSILESTAIQGREFKSVYHKRWGVEEAFKRIKSRLELENFSGKSVLAVEQDFYAKMATYNFAALLALAAEPEVKKEGRHGKYVYAVNHAQALSRLKSVWVKMYNLPTAALTKCITELVEVIALNREAIRPGRSYERKVIGKKKSRFPVAYKRTL
jgi:hypothetical protein